MKKWGMFLLVMGLATVAYAGDSPMANTTGVPGDVPDMPPIVFNEPVCGLLVFDGENGYAAQRRPDGLESWVIAPCTPGAAKQICWLAIDNSTGDWDGTCDYAGWETMDGCQDDSTACVMVIGARNSREPLLDDNGNQVVLFGRLAWIYCVEVTADTSCANWIAPRISIGNGQSFILTRALGDEGQTWFQSEFFGIPCAIPGSDLFGVEKSNAIQVYAGEPRTYCVGTVTGTRRFEGPCKDRCPECPFNIGDRICFPQVCETAQDCPRRGKFVLPCEGGGFCRLRASKNDACAACTPICR